MPPGPQAGNLFSSKEPKAVNDLKSGGAGGFLLLPVGGSGGMREDEWVLVVS